MSQLNPQPGELFRHFKGKKYQVLQIAIHSETREPLVIYQALYEPFGVYARPYDMFISEVDHEKYPEVEQKYRFEFVDKYYHAELLEVTCSKPDSPIKHETPVVRVNSSVKEVSEEKEVAKKKEPTFAPDEIPVGVNPNFLAFLDADTFAEKLDILNDIREVDIDDRFIDNCAVTVDAVIPEGNLSTRLEQLKYAVRTRQKYELNRFR